MHIKPGTTNAIVGPTGAGKTTLVSLLSRFYDIHRDNGAILIDGKDIRDVCRESMINQMASVLQEPYIFTGTVRENIKYRHEEVTEEEMISASQAVGCHELIMKLPQNYNTMLEERGSNLSLGERQLISFARALVAAPKILILDEATANIDSHTEQMIQKNFTDLVLVKLLLEMDNINLLLQIQMRVVVKVLKQILYGNVLKIGKLLLMP